MPEKKNHKFVCRELSLEVRAIEAEARTIEFSFSSELPVERWYGKEILSHAPGAVDLSRLNAGANCLMNHDMDDYLGVVQKAWIGEDKRGYCQVRFSKNEEADEVFQDIADGILRNVSVGYQVNEMVLSKQAEGEDSEYTATKWTPMEVSIVTVPADPSVGIGRSQSGDSPAMVRMVEDARAKFEQSLKNAGRPAQEEREKMEVQVNEGQVRADAIKAERERAKAITALCEKHEMGDMARELIEGDKSLDEARAIVLEKITGRKQTPVTGKEAEIGLTDKEVQRFSFMKAIRAQMDPKNRKFQEEAAFEREVSEAAQAKTGKTARGLLVPFDVLGAPLKERALSVGTSTAGGNLVATDLLMGSFIEILRNKSILIEAGAQVLSGLVGNIAIPRATGAATAYWVGEAAAPSESDQAFDQVSMSPKSIAAYTDYSRKLMLQTSLDVESFVRGDLAKIIALGIDLAGFYGLGSANQPLGLKGTSGINTTDLAADIPTWAELVGMEAKVQAANADVGVMKYITNATCVGNLKVTPKIGSTYPMFMLENGEANGYPVLMSNQVASGDYWFGVWSQLIFGFWSGLDILVDPYSLSTSGSIRVVAHQDCDIGVRHAPSFTRANNTL